MRRTSSRSTFHFQVKQRRFHLLHSLVPWHHQNLWTLVLGGKKEKETFWRWDPRGEANCAELLELQQERWERQNSEELSEEGKWDLIGQAEAATRLQHRLKVCYGSSSVMCLWFHPLSSCHKHKPSIHGREALEVQQCSFKYQNPFVFFFTRVINH